MYVFETIMQDVIRCGLAHLFENNQ